MEQGAVHAVHPAVEDARGQGAAMRHDSPSGRKQRKVQLGASRRVDGFQRTSEPSREQQGRRRELDLLRGPDIGSPPSSASG
jgi:hypothetical protein